MNSPEDHTVVVLGASTNPERYANRAVRMLMGSGYHVVPVNPNCEEVEGLPCKPTLADVQEPVHTLTVYVKANISSRMADEIVAMAPGRVIFNPGTENPALEATLAEASIPTEKACTLVLLTTDQF